MRCGYDHRDAGLADLHGAQPVHHGDASDGMGARDIAPDLGQHLHGHRLITFVIQEFRRAALGVVSNDALEIHNGAIFAAQKLPGNFRGVDRLASEREKIALLALADLLRVAAGTTAYRRQECDFIAIGNWRRRCAELMVRSQNDAGFQSAQPGKQLSIPLENRFHARSVRDLDLILRTPYDVSQHAEKQDSYTHFCHSIRRFGVLRVSTTCCGRAGPPTGWSSFQPAAGRNQK